MGSFEGVPLEREVGSEEVSKEKIFEEDLTDRFFTLLEKEPATGEVVREMKVRFNEMEVVTKRAFDDSLESARSHERLEIIDLFARRSALHYRSLQKIMVEMLELATHLSEEEVDEVIKESHKIAVFYEGHTLLSFYANRTGLDKRGVDSLKRNTENAALQQYMARFYLENSGELEDVEKKLDSYGKRAFGSEIGYEAFKKGVISLADAYNHMESLGRRAFFPPPKMDAEIEMDLISVDSEVYDKNADELEEFFNSNFSLKDLKELESKFDAPVYGVQVKTRHGLKDIYPDIEEGEKGLDEILKELSLSQDDLDGLDSRVIEETKVSSSNIESVTGGGSSAVVFSCEPIPDRTFSFGNDGGSRSGGSDRETERIKGDIQEAGIFMGRTEGVGSMYVFVEQLQDQN